MALGWLLGTGRMQHHVDLGIPPLPGDRLLVFGDGIYVYGTLRTWR